MEESATKDVEVFEIDDDFDPLEDMGLETGEQDDRDVEEQDYQAPIPDAELSHVPEPVVLPPKERIEKLVAGIPGQKFRIYGLVELCREPRTVPEAAAELEKSFPQRGNVYDAGLLMELLVDAGALEKLEDQADAAEQDAPEPETASAAMPDADANPADDAEEEEYLQVTKPPKVRYQATEDGLSLAEGATSLSAVVALFDEDPRYLAFYRRILEMCSQEGGVYAKAVGDAIDDEALELDPPRPANYFLGKLEGVAALRWDDTWQITRLGRQALESGVFEDER